MIDTCKREICSNTFTHRSNKKYCSRKCKGKESARRNQRRAKNRRPYIVFKKGFCEECGFIPKHRCQLDVDHIDGNNKNNEESNLQTLCANCHRLKTYIKKDWLIKK